MVTEESCKLATNIKPLSSTGILTTLLTTGTQHYLRIVSIIIWLWSSINLSYSPSWGAQNFEHFLLFLTSIHIVTFNIYNSTMAKQLNHDTVAKKELLCDSKKFIIIFRVLSLTKYLIKTKNSKKKSVVIIAFILVESHWNIWIVLYYSSKGKW